MSEELAPNQKAQNFRATIAKLVGEFAIGKFTIIVAGLLSVVGTVMTILAPLLLGKATDLVFNGYLQLTAPAGLSQDAWVEQLRAQGNNDQAEMVAALNLIPGAGIDFRGVAIFLLATLTMYILAEVMVFWSGWLFNSLVQRVMYRMRERVENKIHRVPLAYLDKQQRGDLLSRLNNDLDNISMVVAQNIQQLFTNVVTLVGVLAMMLFLSWELTLVVLASIPLTAVVVGLVGVRSQKEFGIQWKSTGELNGLIEESITGAHLLEVYGAVDRVSAQFDEKNAQVYRASRKAQVLSGSIMPAMQFVSNLIFVGIAILGALRVATGSMTLGTVQAFIQYSRQFSQPLSQLGGMASQFQSAAASAERVYELLDAPEESVEVNGHPNFQVTRGEVEFKDVAFSYDPKTPLISDLNLRAEPGQTVAIVGRTGAGKTTLVNLLLRFYDVTAGSITIDGVPIDELTRNQARSPIGMVLQDTWLFEGSIYDNIAYGHPAATHEMVMAAAKAAYVDQFVSHLPHGYDTVITETADNISAGQRQLITIARAFVADPAILVLDEATSSVDSRTEVLVQQAMNTLRQGRTAFVIAHRLSTIRDADTIVVMDAGHIIEQGSHNELVARGGAYAALYEASLAGSVGFLPCPKRHTVKHSAFVWIFMYPGDSSGVMN